MRGDIKASSKPHQLGKKKKKRSPVFGTTVVPTREYSVTVQKKSAKRNAKAANKPATTAAQRKKRLSSARVAAADSMRATMGANRIKAKKKAKKK